MRNQILRGIIVLQEATTIFTWTLAFFIYLGLVFLTIMNNTI